MPFFLLKMWYDKIMTSLEKSILATLAYYDVLDRPLTGWEIFRYLIRRCQGNLNSVLQSLETSPQLSKFIEQKNGFYFLKGREKIFKERISRQKTADQKWKKARRLIKFLQIIPFIRLVAVSGSLAMNNPKPRSDIDLLVVAKTNRIWTCRGLTTLFVHLIGQRRHKKLTKDRLCLNHYLTDKFLKIPFKSLYNAQTYVHLVPMLDFGNSTWKEFQKNNEWLKNYLAYYPQSANGYLLRIKPNRFLSFLREIPEFFLDRKLGNGLECFLRKIQEKRIRKDPLTYQSGGRVVFNSRQLEFHPNSPEKRVLEKYNAKMKDLGFNELAQEEDSGLTI